MKTCSKCNTTKQFDSFHKRESSKDGYRNECVECLKIMSRRRYQKNKEQYIMRAKNHRDSKPGYRVWEGMIRRCYSEAHQAYPLYGGRGIFVCDEWRHSYENFSEWLISNGWEKGLQLDRIDNNSNYTPDNCRIVSPMINSNNKRTNRTLLVNGDRMTISEASRKFGLKNTTIKERLNRGWTDEKAVSPVRRAA